MVLEVGLANTDLVGFGAKAVDVERGLARRTMDLPQHALEEVLAEENVGVKLVLPSLHFDVQGHFSCGL